MSFTYDPISNLYMPGENYGVLMYEIAQGIIERQRYRALDVDILSYGLVLKDKDGNDLQMRGAELGDLNNTIHNPYYNANMRTLLDNVRSLVPEYVNPSTDEFWVLADLESEIGRSLTQNPTKPNDTEFWQGLIDTLKLLTYSYFTTPIQQPWVYPEYIEFGFSHPIAGIPCITSPGLGVVDAQTAWDNRRYQLAATEGGNCSYFVVPYPKAFTELRGRRNYTPSVTDRYEARVGQCQNCAADFTNINQPDIVSGDVRVRFVVDNDSGSTVEMTPVGSIQPFENYATWVSVGPGNTDEYKIFQLSVNEPDEVPYNIVFSPTSPGPHNYEQKIQNSNISATHARLYYDISTIVEYI